MKTFFAGIDTLTRNFERLDNKMVSIVEHLLPGDNFQLVTNSSSVIVGGKCFTEKPPKDTTITEIRKVKYVFFL